MKKIMYFAAALLVLAGCQSSQEARENAPAEMVTIKGRIELPQGPNKIAPQSDWKETTVGGYINFQWELGDSVAVFKASKTSCECEKFKVTSIDEEGTATLAGEALSSGMDTYIVFYPYIEITSTLNLEQASNAILLQQTYKKDSFKPIVMGSGEENAFTLNMFNPAIHLQLKGTVVLGKIEYRGLESGGQAEEETLARMTFEGGLQLDNTTPTDVVIFVPVPNSLDYHGFELSFYDTAGQLIMKKKSETALSQNTITPFPVLTVADPTRKIVNGHEAVQLWENGPFWATCNVGATNPQDYGDYFAWGETETKTDYSWSTYKYCNGSGTTMTKYCKSTKYGTYDNKTVLESADDAASVKWGGGWRMPTEAEFQKLLDNCEKSWTTYNGVGGYKFTSKTNSANSIFLRAAGYFDGTSRYSAGSHGRYWSSSLYSSYSNDGRYLYFRSGYVDMNYSYRYYGQSVRPVCK